MEALAEDLELEFELQEIYLTGKQWMADLAFLESEHIFLAAILADKNYRTEDVEEQLTAAAIVQNKLQTDARDFINKIEDLIVDPNGIIRLSLVDDFIGLEIRVGEALLHMKGIKHALVNARRAA